MNVENGEVGIVKGQVFRHKRNPSPVLITSRIHLPEAAAASLRLSGVERALLDRGVPVRVLTTLPPDACIGRCVEDDSEQLKISRWPALRDSQGYLRGYLPYMSFDIPLFFRYLASGRPAVTLVEPPPTTGVIIRTASALFNRPYVWYAADVWSDASGATGAPTAVVKAVEWMEGFAMRGAAQVIAVNDQVAERARAFGAKRVTVVPNGIDTDLFSVDGGVPTEEEKQRFGITGKYLIYAGNASEVHGAHIFAQAMELLFTQYPDVQLLYLGRGADWPTIEKYAQNSQPTVAGGKQIVTADSVPGKDAARWQRGALASVVSLKPGQGYDYAYTTKALASLSCGTPVVYAGVGPAGDDICAYDLGWVADYDVQSVSHALTAAIVGKEMDEGKMLRAARERHQWVEEHHSLRTTGATVSQILQQVVKRGS